jgi:hypothetical protein
MDPRIVELKRHARELSHSRPQPAFVLECAEELSHASNLFFDHPLMLRLQNDALGFLNDACGLGVEHGKRVAVDAAALVLVEPSGLNQEERRRLALLAEMAGLLHDSMRHEDDHPDKGADLCLRILRGYPLAPEERVWIAQAVSLHEADQPQAEGGPENARLLSGAVHDADRFRFGPDIFTATLWEFCECDDWTLEEIVRTFPKGPEHAGACAHGFRTEQGRRYGPAMLSEGLALAKDYERLFQKTLAANAPSNT